MIKVDGPKLNISELIDRNPNLVSRRVERSDTPEEGPSELRGRVKSIMEPLSFSSPEMMVIPRVPLEEQVLEESHRFPAGSRQVTFMRGDNGFGITVVEGKVGGVILMKLSC